MRVRPGSPATAVRDAAKRATVALCLLGSLAVAFPASAGGSGSRYEVLTMKRRGTSARFTLRLAGPLHPHTYPNCEELEVRVAHTTLRWWVTGQGEKFPRSAHREALDLLERARISGEPIFFGWMGEGFGYPDPKDRCSVTSRALVLDPSEHEAWIFSYFKWP